mmetsp:Transcript_10398/g.35879  ORF Transcript_10398/g.35879 Transcript_10398/m.35879 type:complete len:364 (+) Transcript_10398:567-1658(+)
MHKGSSPHPRHRVERGAPQSPPVARQGFPLAEATLPRLGHAHDPPLSLPIVLVQAVQHLVEALRHRLPLLLLQLEQVVLPRAIPVELEDLAGLVHLPPGLHRPPHNFSGREPALVQVGELLQELLAGHLAGLLKLAVLDLRACVLVPGGVQGAHPVAKRGLLQVDLLDRRDRHHVRVRVLHHRGLAVLRLPLLAHPGLVLLHPVIHGVDALHKVPVHGKVEGLGIRVLDREAALGGHDLTPKVLVHEPRAAKLGLIETAHPQNLIEPPLVVVISVPRVVIHPTHVDHAVQVLQDLLVSRPRDGRVGELFRPPEQKAAEGLVTVKGPAVRPDRLHRFRPHCTLLSTLLHPMPPSLSSSPPASRS